MSAINFTDYPTITVIICFVNLPVYPQIIKTFYGEWYEKAPKDFWLMDLSDLEALFEGQTANQFFADLKLRLCIVFCVGWPLSIAEAWVRFFYL